MSDTKISQFTVKTYSELTNPATAVIPVVDDGANFSISVNELFSQFSNAGTGARIYKSKTNNNVSLRSITANSNKVNVSENTDTISIDVNESNIPLDNLQGTLSINKGGTGKALTPPTTDHILFYDESAGAMDFLKPNPSLIISGNTIAINEPAVNLANCNNSEAQFYKDGSTIRTSEVFVSTASNVEIGPASVQTNNEATHLIEVSINGTVYYLFAKI